LFIDSPKFSLTGVADLFGTFEEESDIWEGRVSLLTAPPPGIAAEQDLSRGKPAGKIVDFYLTGGSKRQVLIRPFFLDHDIFQKSYIF
jgi:hypothetical protein